MARGLFGQSLPLGPGEPPIYDRDKTKQSSPVAVPPPPQYLSSYMPALLQDLHYLTEMLTYEQKHMTTIEPPLIWKPDPGETTTSRPVTIVQDEYVVATTTKKPSTVWWVPPTTTRYNLNIKRNE